LYRSPVGSRLSTRHGDEIAHLGMDYTRCACIIAPAVPSACEKDKVAGSRYRLCWLAETARRRVLQAFPEQDEPSPLSTQQRWRSERAERPWLSLRVLDSSTLERTTVGCLRRCEAVAASVQSHVLPPGRCSMHRRSLVFLALGWPLLVAMNAGAFSAASPEEV